LIYNFLAGATNADPAFAASPFRTAVEREKFVFWLSFSSAWSRAVRHLCARSLTAERRDPTVREWLRCAARDDYGGAVSGELT
jgi:hypothetical protein